MSDTNMAKRVLTKILGLDSTTVEKLIKIIQTSNSRSNIQNNKMRANLGGASIASLTKAMDLAGNNKPEKTDDGEKGIDNKQEKIKAESTDFKGYLLNELMVDVDPNDPAAATAATRKKIQMAKQNPSRVNRMDAIDAAKERSEVSKEEGPAKQLKVQRAKLKQQLANLNKRIDQVEKNGN